MIISLLSNSIYADVQNNSKGASIINESSVLSRKDVYKEKRISTKNSTWTPDYSFNIPEKADYFNVDFDNTSEGEVIVKILDENGDTYDKFKVEKGEHKYLTLGTTGEFSIKIDKQGGNIKGILTIAYYFEDDNILQEEAISIIDEEPIYSRKDIYINEKVSTKNSTWTPDYSFNIPEESDHFNVDFNNTSEGEVIVKILDENGDIYDKFKVGKGEHKYLRVGSTGEFSVKIDKQGGNIRGILTAAYYEDSMI